MKAFLDSNIFIYSFLNQDVAKKSVAAKIVAQSVRDRNGYVSLQVANEFCNVMTKKSAKTADEISQALQVLDKLNFVQASTVTVRKALEIKDRYDIQFYDALIVAAAVASGCDLILTEDLNDGQMYCGIKAVNPFK